MVVVVVMPSSSKNAMEVRSAVRGSDVSVMHRLGRGRLPCERDDAI